MMISNGWRMLSSAEPRGRTESTARDEQPIIIIIIIISTTMFMVLSSWQSHCESSHGSSDECGMAPSGRRPKTKPDDLGCESACTGCQKLHPPSPFIITQPESWYSFYRPTEGRRLSRPSWMEKMNIWRHQYELAMTNLFSLEALVCRDETERWSREKAERLFNALWKTVKRECLRRSNKGNQPSSSSWPVTEVVQR